MKQSVFKLVAFIALTGFAALACAQDPVSEEALFYRCYAHLTQSRPKLSNPLLAQVKSGAKSALQACTETLDRARFLGGGGTQISDTNDAIAKSVLQSMHQLHRSWSRETGLFGLFDDREEIATEVWFQDNPIADYFTRALFSSSHDARSIVQGRDFLQPVRTTMTPALPYRGIPSTAAGNEQEFVLGAQQPLAPRGELLGIRSVSLSPIDLFAPVRFTNLSTMPDFANIGVSPLASRAITQINFPDITAVRGPIPDTTQFAIQIRGRLQVAAAGSYRLYLSVDDGGELFINQNRIINQLGTGEGFADITLAAGSHDLEVQFRQRTGSARLIMSWQGPGFGKQVVPASAFSNLNEDFYIESRRPSIKLTGSEGGGFLGNHNYFLTTFLQNDSNYVPNGAERVNRTWARAALKDALCREVPVVRESDAEQFVIPASNVPFRQAAACSACHASLDRQAGVIRGLRWNAVRTDQNDSPAPDLVGILSFDLKASSLLAEQGWPDTPDNEYGDKQSRGRLYFRNYRGELVDVVVNSLDELGTAIAAQDDYYACIAKRYYRYFLGIDAELGDPGNSTYPPLNAVDSYHRSKVIDLGLRLKSHGSLRQLILDIMSSGEYRMSDYGISYSGSN